MRQNYRKNYSVGWVCALPIELAAAKMMLDEEHEPSSQDANLYTLGRIGKHNVVIACLPAGQMGTNSAAIVAAQMKSTFKSIRFGLMVGIGGGVPGAEADIRLGDVVVSQPYNGHGGVIQYDFGKTTPSGLQRAGFLNAPPAILLNAVQEIRANHSIARTGLPESISRLSYKPVFARDSAGSDVLFEASYDHAGGPTCVLCSGDRRVNRQPRKGQDIVIHYGTIASGNQIIRDGITRDRVSLELGGVLCFEMEAAGLMNRFPCLVIRGICDYADSHKNKKWQAYAAGTAAAYAKEILSVIPPANVVITSPVDETIQKKEAIDRMSPLILQDTAKRPEWRALLRRSIGCGKSIIMTTVIEATIAKAQSVNKPVLQFIYDHSFRRHLTACALFESYTKQLLMYIERSNKSCPSAIITRIVEFYGSKKRRPDVQELIVEVLVPLCQIFEATGAIFLVDGVDECSRQEALEILWGFRQLLALPSSGVVICCREEVKVLQGIPDSNQIWISAKDTRADLEVFVNKETEKRQRDRSISSNEAVLHSIRREILNKADGM
ncbi:putative kinesin [Glonium stellatum]|uniref:Putative kinesin n=1 Tax=Glonium stellatum TaxID=574774 RepID=A0A8E2JMH0_9PEZI|nr:putative kinesin [Glonium stellatum]